MAGRGGGGGETAPSAGGLRATPWIRITIDKTRSSADSGRRHAGPTTMHDNGTTRELHGKAMLLVPAAGATGDHVGPRGLGHPARDATDGRTLRGAPASSAKTSRRVRATAAAFSTSQTHASTPGSNSPWRVMGPGASAERRSSLRATKRSAKGGSAQRHWGPRGRDGRAIRGGYVREWPSVAANRSSELRKGRSGQPQVQKEDRPMPGPRFFQLCRRRQS